ncbi:hypothetical protein G195_006908 [Phytophthora kernoviae 00238/432]|uniref:Elicitin-like protein n=1 Tax=Phytophthora kernoviae 00238/432 TaxID=1284355 RepID=A0A8J4W596_9STRA|nr:hypothetical protein G195_006908 [Phytophthora kernoviae 00238/432]
MAVKLPNCTYNGINNKIEVQNALTSCNGGTTEDAGIYILTACSSDCANKIKDLAEALPNCYYDYDSMNKKEDVLEELDDCEATSSHISITVYDDTIGLSPSAGSEAVTSSDTPSSAETTNAPASDSLLDTSSSGLLQSVAPNIASSGILYVWVLSMLLAGINQVL